jgi:hypothetical protein
MITYEVSATIDDPAIAQRYERYMKDKHLRDVLASGCFVDATLARAGEGHYRALYRAPTQEDVDRYLKEHTALLREDFAKQFPKGVRLEREIWTDVHMERS